ncbi:hypothetical protein [Thomasclavelia cocleata]|jgi:hypothetical protein|uniref:Thioredoxin n=1 Tax=Thomasclavelia cocleata TaxID=69824 RepID=A0A829ZAL5_9FIRM|nr:hypothetical protein [Thomasclavelia cocleata]MCI9132305.1 hypothetical protein [Thomasclavelia cocleata]MCI9631298.1 hypothetical protein [Thomasclavelia cocleata]GFI41015.1 hypothetical protein IMSAGC017_01055 [Thomasclavelia cocleata]
MEKVKKLWKEISIFGIVIVVFLGLFIYRKITHVEFTTITQNALVEKVKDKDSFVVVIGNKNDNATLSYQDTMTTFLEKNRSESLYYVDVSNDSDYTTWLEKDLDITNGTVPQTIVYKDGKISTTKTGALSYYRLAQLFK